MLDPKFNALPVEEDDLEEGREGSLSSASATERKPRRGLSINDTIAGDTALSVGSRGVDTSGVRAGSGSGAGMTAVTPGDDGSPAPNIVPGARGSGTTPIADTAPGQQPTTRLNAGSEGQEVFTREQIAERAYHCWHQRGCPHGSPEVDWDLAEQQLRIEREKRRGATA